MVTPSSRILDRMQVTFEDHRAVANAGLLLPATLAAHLGAGALLDETVDLGDDPGAPNPARKALTVVLAMLAGGQFIDDVDLLRAGSSGRVVGFDPAAPSTVGTFLRAFTFGHVRQLDKAAEELLGRAWEAGTGPAAGESRDAVAEFSAAAAERSEAATDSLALPPRKSCDDHPE